MVPKSGVGSPKMWPESASQSADFDEKRCRRRPVGCGGAEEEGSEPAGLGSA